MKDLFLHHLECVNKQLFNIELNCSVECLLQIVVARTKFIDWVIKYIYDVFKETSGL